MTAIALRQDTAPALIPDAAAGLVEWAHAAQAAHTLALSLVKTSFVPQKYRGKPDEAAVAMLAGAELGLSPLASLRAFDDIQGTAAPKAITLRAVAQSHGHELVVETESDTAVIVAYRRKGADKWSYVEWTIEQARGLGLTSKDNWKKQPKAMLVARATSEAARRVASDAILGIPYSAEELQDAIPEPTAKVARAPRTVQRQAKPETPEPDFDEPVSLDVERIKAASMEAVESKSRQDPVKAVAERADEPITPAQLKKLHASLGDAGLSDRDAGLAFISQAIGRDVDTSKDLSKAEASLVIERLAEPAEPTLDGVG